MAINSDKATRAPDEEGLLGPRPFLTLFSLSVYALILAPVVMVAAMSFFDQELVSFPVKAWTASWYVNAWNNPDFTRGLLASLKISIIATLIGVPLGVAAGYALVRSEMRWKGSISLLLLGPLVIPGIIAGAAIYIFFVQLNDGLGIRLANSMTGLVLAHVLLTIPWSMRLTFASLEGIDKGPEEAAANLGASPLIVFWRVTLPALKPAIVGGSIFSFIQSFENLEMTLFLVGPGTTTLPIAMMNYLEFRADPTVAAVATIQILIVAVALLVTDRFVNIARVMK
jgi:putative spermidine/putrescine transport system permease protein